MSTVQTHRHVIDEDAFVAEWRSERQTVFQCWRRVEGRMRHVGETVQTGLRGGQLKSGLAEARAMRDWGLSRLSPLTRPAG